jgi:hypothetical protein
MNNKNQSIKKRVTVMILCLVMVLSTPITTLAFEDSSRSEQNMEIATKGNEGIVATQAQQENAQHEHREQFQQEQGQQEHEQQEQNQQEQGQQENEQQEQSQQEQNQQEQGQQEQEQQDNKEQQENKEQENSNQQEPDSKEKQGQQPGQQEKHNQMEQDIASQKTEHPSPNHNVISQSSSTNEETEIDYCNMTNEERWALWNATQTFVEPRLSISTRSANKYSVGQEFIGALTITGANTFPADPGAGYPYESSFTFGDVTGILAELTVPSNILWCLQPNQPEPPVGARITYIATVVSVDEVNGRAYFNIFAPNANPFQDMGTKFGNAFIDWEPATGGVRIRKIDAETGQANPQGDASFAGAVFNILSQNDHTVYVNGQAYSKGQVVLTLTTNESGVAATGNTTLPQGRYQLEEVSAPSGYRIPTDNKRTFDIKENGVIVDVTVLEPIIRGNVEVVKQDVESITAQGMATLIGVEFEIRNESKNAILFNGRMIMPKEIVTKISTTLREGKAVARTTGNALPYGTYSITEVKESTGYLLTDGTPRIFTIREHNSTVTRNTGGTPLIFRNNVISGDVQIVKFGEQAGNIQRPLEGVKFHFTSLTTGKVTTIVTDSQGFAHTNQLGNPRGGLVFDRYKVTETSPHLDFDIIEPFEITIDKEGQTLYYILRNDVIEAPVVIRKVDSTTGNIIPLPDTQFQVLDKDGEAISMMVTRYPSIIKTDVFHTDESGQLMLPEQLPVGKYSIREVKAPYGYLLGEDIPFTVEQGYSWENPIIITFANDLAKGKIEITKTDESTGEPLKGVVFEVRAREDIVTGDGTIRALAKEVMETITTDENGFATTGELFLGEYEIEEIQGLSGYILSGVALEVNLVYADQHTTLTTASKEVLNKPNRLTVLKTEAGTNTPLEGVEFTLWHEDFPENKEELITDKDGRISVERLSSGSWFLQEKKALVGYLPQDTLFTFQVGLDGLIEGKEVFEITVENARTQIIKTVALDVLSGTDQVKPTSTVSVNDKVYYENAIIGRTYLLKATAMNRTHYDKTGEIIPLLIDGEPLTSEVQFVTTTSEGYVFVPFTFDGTDLDGLAVTFFERLYIIDEATGEITVDEDGKELLIGGHEDIYDEEQTIHFIEFIETEPETPKISPAPQTGDNGNIFRWIAIALIATSFLVVSIKKHKSVKGEKADDLET